MNRRSGFTLLEVLVATLIMGIAVAGLIGGLSQATKNAARLTDYDRAGMLARTQMNEFLADSLMPLAGAAEGQFPAGMTGQMPSGWRAEWRPFEMPPQAPPGTMVLVRIDLEVWWQPATGTRRSIRVEGFKRGYVPQPPEGASK